MKERSEKALRRNTHTAHRDGVISKQSAALDVHDGDVLEGKLGGRGPGSWNARTAPLRATIASATARREGVMVTTGLLALEHRQSARWEKAVRFS
jgi:hypothetical protein